MTAYLFATSSAKEIVVVSDKICGTTSKMIDIMREKFRPFDVSILFNMDDKEIKGLAPFLEDYKNIDDKETAYVCENFACQSPITDTEVFREIL